MYGKELILDFHNCNVDRFNRADIERYFIELCVLIDMERQDLHFWDDVGVPIEDHQTEPHLKGTSAIQFISTSNVTLHALELTGALYINIFSCKDFDAEVAAVYTKHYFGGTLVNRAEIIRQ